MKPKVCLSIVSHYQRHLVEQLLSDIDKYLVCEECQLEVWITDNTNEKMWVTHLENFQCFKVNNPNRKGFGDNHNSAFYKANADFFFVVNPDVRFTSPVKFDEIIAQMEDFKIYSPKILNKSGLIEDYRRHEITVTNLIRRRFALEEIEGREWFAGIFHGYTKQTFLALGGFDTRYFMYVEDADICLRLQKMGGNIEDLQNFTIIHEAQRQSLKKIKNFWWHFKSLMIYFIKKYLYS